MVWTKPRGWVSGLWALNRTRELGAKQQGVEHSQQTRCWPRLSELLGAGEVWVAASTRLRKTVSRAEQQHPALELDAPGGVDASMRVPSSCHEVSVIAGRR